MNSWTQRNKIFRESILLPLNFDIIGIVETKLTNNNEISLHGYKWLGHNRTNLRQNDNGSGGVGLFIKDYLYEIYDISIFDKNFRDVLIVQFKDKKSNYSFVICVYYLPPENNINGRISQGFYDFLTNIIFKLDDFDMCLFMGDMHARCGQESDVVAVIDGSDIRSRNVIDDTKNSRGPIFMDFLKSVNYLLINGRITPELDNFTCISHKGRSVVDYMFTPRENIKNIEQCAVLTVT